MRSHNSGSPTVTVLLCAYRPQREYLPLAVRSVLRQSFPDLELLIVEDPSEIDGREFVSDIGDPRLRYVRNTSRTSLVEQKNQGLALARGEFVALIDADDVAEPERLEKQLAHLRRHAEVGVVGSNVRLINAAGEPIGYRCFPTEHEDIVRAMHEVVPLCHPSVMARRAVMVNAGGYQYKKYPAAEDYELYSRLIHQGVRFANLSEPLLRYRLHPQQIKARYLKATIRAVLDVKSMYWRTHMNWRARLRMAAEWSLLGLPSRLVYNLLLLTQYRDSSPAGQLPNHSPRPGLAIESVGAAPVMRP